MALTLRTLKGSRLTHEELDNNFRHFTASHAVDGTVTATAFVGDGSGLTGVTAAADLTGTGVVSGSVQLDGGQFGFGSAIEATGSFTGSFVGDGSGLTGISAGASAISGLSDVNLNTLADGEYLSYDAASSKWLNVGAPTADLTGTTVISGSGLEYNSGQTMWNSSEYFTFKDYTAIVNNPAGASVGTDLFRISAGPTFGTGYSEFRFNRSGLLTNNAHAAFKNIILQVEDGVFHMWSGSPGVGSTITMKSADGHVSASLFSGSFAGDGANLTGVTAAATSLSLTVLGTSPSGLAATGSMVLADDGLGTNVLWVFTGAGSVDGWAQVSMS